MDAFHGFPWNLIFKEDGGFRWGMIALIWIIAMVIGVVVAEVIYGDWRCAFGECRIIK